MIIHTDNQLVLVCLSPIAQLLSTVTTLVTLISGSFCFVSRMSLLDVATLKMCLFYLIVLNLWILQLDSRTSVEIVTAVLHNAWMLQSASLQLPLLALHSVCCYQWKLRLFMNWASWCNEFEHFLPNPLWPKNIRLSLYLKLIQDSEILEKLLLSF